MQLDIWFQKNLLHKIEKNLNYLDKNIPSHNSGEGCFFLNNKIDCLALQFAKYHCNILYKGAEFGHKIIHFAIKRDNYDKSILLIKFASHS